MINKNEPTILVILGVTGDLAAKKILPALFNLHKKAVLPENFQILGFGRREYDQPQFQKYVKETVKHRLPDTEEHDLGQYAEILDYVQGTFETPPSYIKLAEHIQGIEKKWGKSAHLLFYLSVPPDVYEPIISNIRSSALYRTGDDSLHTRILVEKPIGKNAKTAGFLESLLSSSFTEQEIYRIDHYLAKEMIQNILTFRFGNDMFEKTWNTDSIEKIEIKLWETLGVEQRGNFYDGMGALRDVGQNHLLQMLALLTMNTPQNFSSTTLHAKRGEVLNKLHPLTKEEVSTYTYRAQYHGYRTISGVTPDSNTETYFKVRSYIEDPRWENVPLIIESGKRMHEQRKEVIITYRHVSPCLCPNQEQHHQNKITFSLEPTEGINIQFWSKKPGFDSELENRTIDFMLRDITNKPQYIEEYEKLLLDAILGDQTLFVSTAEVKAMWRFIDPIIEAWEENIVPLKNYTVDTDEAISSSETIS